MNLLLNFASATWLGGRYYLENLARALSRLDHEQRPRVLVNVDDPRLADLGVAVSGVPAEADVVFPNWGLGRHGAAAELHWIPDLQHRALPENFSLRERARRDLGYRRLARRAQLVVVSSNVVGAAVGSAYARARVKLRVLHFRTVVPDDVLAAGPGDAVRRHGLPEDFLLLPNQLWKHKNHATAFAALPDLPLPLVCTGEPSDHRRPEYAGALLEDVRRRGLNDRLHVLGVVPRTDYLQLVRSARAVVQPSLFEGWSSVVEDARAFGKPIALSDIAVHREQEPPRAAFFSPRDAEGLAAAVAAALEHGSAPEEEALRQQEQLVLSYARQFVEIAREAVGTLRR